MLCCAVLCRAVLCCVAAYSDERFRPNTLDWLTNLTRSIATRYAHEARLARGAWQRHSGGWRVVRMRCCCSGRQPRWCDRRCTFCRAFRVQVCVAAAAAACLLAP